MRGSRSNYDHPNYPHKYENADYPTTTALPTPRCAVMPSNCIVLAQPCPAFIFKSQLIPQSHIHSFLLFPLLPYPLPFPLLVLELVGNSHFLPPNGGFGFYNPP